MSKIAEQIITIGKAARVAARDLALLATTVKNQALRAMAAAIRGQQETILAANQKDMAAARQKNLSDALIDRLALNSDRVAAMANGLDMIADLPDPVGVALKKIQRPNGLEIVRVSTPIGVIGVIYESRPNVTVDAAGLCLKSGNAVILRGGSESFYSCSAIMSALQKGLRAVNVPLTAVQFVPTVDRMAVDE
ncbi:MAG TPA: aldehyde dehydrogenase family protein, partial [Candidatus Angelobacter sp.]|nr:aldehyde dehydrogenase family protein [Candidatus Angelobacter sp.]